MGENLYVGSHRYQTRDFDEGWVRTFAKEAGEMRKKSKGEKQGKEEKGEAVGGLFKVYGY